MIIIPDKLRRPAEVEREELRKQLAEAQAEIDYLERIVDEMTEEQAALCAVDQNITELVAEKNKQLTDAQAEIENLKWHINSEKAKAEAALALNDRALGLVEQMREALKAIDGIGREAGNARREDALRCFAIAAAALAAEGGE